MCSRFGLESSSAGSLITLDLDFDLLLVRFASFRNGVIDLVLVGVVFS
jgi:hypothetical protein